MKRLQVLNKMLVSLAAVGCFAFAVLWRGLPEPNPLKLAVGTRLGSEALVYALSQGKALSASELRLIEMSGATAISRALENGVADAAVLSVDEAVQLNDAGQPVRFAFVLEESVGADVLLTTAKVPQLKDLKGARIGVEVRSSGHYLLFKALERGGLTLADVELIPLTRREVPTALQEGAVDALVVTEPDAVQIAKNDALRLFDSSMLEFPILRVLAVRESAWDSNARMLKILVQRYLQAQPRMRATDAEFLEYLMRRTGLDKQAVVRMLEHCHFPDAEKTRSWLSGPRLENTLDVITRDMMKADLISRQARRKPTWDKAILEP